MKLKLVKGDGVTSVIVDESIYTNNRGAQLEGEEYEYKDLNLGNLKNKRLPRK